MQKVYLAGPIAGLDYLGATGWREDADLFLFQNGIQAYSPMRFKEFLSDIKKFGVNSPEEHARHPLATPRGIMTRDRHDVMTSDAILVNFLGAKERSLGTAMELAWADMLRIPVVAVIEPEGNPNDHAMVEQTFGYRVPDLRAGMDIIVAILKAG